MTSCTNSGASQGLTQVNAFPKNGTNVFGLALLFPIYTPVKTQEQLQHVFSSSLALLTVLLSPFFTSA